MKYLIAALSMCVSFAAHARSGLNDVGCSFVNEQRGATVWDCSFRQNNCAYDGISLSTDSDLSKITISQSEGVIGQIYPDLNGDYTYVSTRTQIAADLVIECGNIALKTD